jgi:hypothetical protein
MEQLLDSLSTEQQVELMLEVEKREADAEARQESFDAITPDPTTDLIEFINLEDGDDFSVLVSKTSEVAKEWSDTTVPHKKQTNLNA